MLNEQIGKILAIDAPLVLVVNAKDSTAEANSTSFILGNDILGIFSGGDHIGFATLIDGNLFRLFIDYSTPERLELENGERKYLVAVGVNSGQYFYIDYLQLISNPPDEVEDAMPVGSPDLIFK